MAEIPEQKEALERLDEEAREVAWGQFDREVGRELIGRGMGLGSGPLAQPWLLRFFRRRKREKS